MKKSNWNYKGIGETKDILGLKKYVHVYEHKKNGKIKYLKMKKSNWNYKGIGETKDILGLKKYVHVYEHKKNGKIKNKNFRNELHV